MNEFADKLPLATKAVSPETTLGQSNAFLRGTVSRVVFRSNDSGFSVLRVEPESEQLDSATSVTLVGEVPQHFGSGTSFIARGVWQTHPRFGKQFRAYSFTEAPPTSCAALKRYLGSGTIKGFGPVLAERVVDYFGDAVLKILDETPERLLEVSGIGEKKLAEISMAWGEKKNIREVLLFFQNHGISLSLAQRIYNAYGERAIETVSKNPYLMAREIWGIGFLTADRIAISLGIPMNSAERIAAGLSYCLEQAADDGHCCLPKEKLLERTQKLLEIEDCEKLEQELARVGLFGDIIQEFGHCYLPELHLDEVRLSRHISSRIAGRSIPKKAILQDLVKSICEQRILAQTPTNSVSAPAVLRLSEEQQQAVELAASLPLLAITGGPGCGKTTVVRAISQLFRRAGLETRLAAPTGRAAQRLSEVCDMPASTIHRLLRLDPISREFQHNETEPLEIDALIVDESSMIDIPLASSLLRALPPGCRVVFVGDADQLPSVGPGLFLQDLLSLAQVPAIRLTKLFRRADESSITQIAHMINHAKLPHIPEPDGKTRSDAYFLPAPTPEEAAALLEKLVVEQIPKKFGIASSDITVLTPMNQGVLGVISLNQRLQARLVPAKPESPCLKVGNTEFRLGDRVCQRINNYNIHPSGVFNGDQGIVTGIDGEKKSLFVELWDQREIEYESDCLYQLDLAYALTIHRSQGSEVPAIVLALHDSHYIMLERQLIYTGITRAKRLLVIVGSRKALATAVKKNRSRNRYTLLRDRILELLT
jgi:exodeoxyribonuclease V alpha subunit